MNNQKGSATVILLVVLVVVVAAVLVYFAFLKKPGEVAISPTPTPIKTATATPDETANWKIYNLNGTKLQFGYPQILTLKETGEQKYGDGSFYRHVSFENNELFMRADVNNPGMGLNMDTTGQKQIQVAGIQANYQTLEHSAEAVPNLNDRKKGVFVQFVKDGSTYSVLFRYPASGPDQSKLIDQILSTFKFTK